MNTSAALVGWRVLAAVARVLASVLLVASVCWCLVEAAPTSTVERAARAAAVLPAHAMHANPEVRAGILAEIERRYQLEGSGSARVLRRVGALTRGDLGRSWRDGSGVSRALGRALPATLLLVGVSFALAFILGLMAAVLAMRAPERKLDTALSALAALAFALPPVWLAMLGLRVLADGHPWRFLPAEGLDSPASLVLPVVCLSLVPTFVIARHARAALDAAMRAPWAVAARARGASRDRVLVVHAMRACAGELSPLMPIVGAYLLGATMVVEEVFGIQGVGALLLSAAAHGDAPVVVGVAVFSGALVAMTSAIADLVQGFLDPRLGRDGAGR